MKLKKITLLLLAWLLLFLTLNMTACGGAADAPTTPEPEITLPSSEKAEQEEMLSFSKFTFYTDGETSFRNKNALLHAVETAKQNHAGESLLVTVGLVEALAKEETYQTLSAAVKAATTPDELREAKQRLNEFSWQYHNALFEAHRYLFEALHYTGLEAIGYSPFVIIELEAEALDADALWQLARSDDVLTVSVSTAPEEIPD